MSEILLTKAADLDEKDSLKKYRDQFSTLKEDGKELLYFCGHSLGLMPLRAKELINNELDRWGALGVEGHFTGDTQWLDYADHIGELNAELIGAKKSEVFLAATLSSNIHHLFATFYRPTKNKFKIIMEAHAFPSDVYAVKSQLKFHGYDPNEGIILIEDGKDSDEEIKNLFAKRGAEVSLVWVGQPNYLSGQAFNTALLSQLAKEADAYIGLDLAHAVGNLELDLHGEEIDFACWCTYKYLNSGPGSIGGIYIHEKHHETDLPRLEGWFGNAEDSRFKMRPEFEPYKDARAWQLSNPPIFQLASLRASLEIFTDAGIKNIHAKRRTINEYLEECLKSECSDFIDIVTPADKSRRGTMLCLRLKDGDPKSFSDKLREAGVICDFREPDILRVAPVALYTRFIDVYNLVKILLSCRS